MDSSLPGQLAKHGRTAVSRNPLSRPLDVTKCPVGMRHSTKQCQPQRLCCRRHRLLHLATPDCGRCPTNDKNEGKRARRPSNKPEWKQRNASEKHSGRAEKPAERKKAKAKKIKKGRATRRNMGPYQDPSWIGGNPKGVKNQNPFTQHLNLKEVEQQKHQER